MRQREPPAPGNVTLYPEGLALAQGLTFAPTPGRSLPSPKNALFGKSAFVRGAWGLSR